MTGADPAGQMTKAFECLPLSCRNGCRLHCPAHAIASSLRTRNKWATMKRPRVYWREAGLLRLPPKRSSSAQDENPIPSGAHSGATPEIGFPKSDKICDFSAFFGDLLGSYRRSLNSYLRSQ